MLAPLPQPHERIWPAKHPIIRCHNSALGATEFNTSNDSRRFRPVTSQSAVVPTLYGADLVEGALSESVFHDVPLRGPGRRVQRKALVPMIRSTVIPQRDLRLVQLHGTGLKKLGVTHGELIETSARQYPRTAAWGQAFYDHDDYDGLVWRSRQFNDSYAVMLWGDRVKRRKDIDVDDANAPLSLYLGAGFDEVQQLADDWFITVVG
ncbi:MAG: RES family NAD+ phosphorylase [Mycobacterium sp.]